MTRPLRIELPGALYHVTSRGDRREPIYLCDEDRLAWLQILGEACERFNWRCHSWCQMDNHYHLVVETVEGNLSQGMRHLNGVYTQYINRAHQRVGHVFQGRYKAVMVEKQSHLLELTRYVVLNPVRAGMVPDAGEWPWSAYTAYVGLAVVPPWLVVDWVLGQFGQKRARAVSQFVDFVRAGVGLPSIWDGLRGQIYLGSDAFVQRMQLLADQPMPEVPRLQRRPMALPLENFVGQVDLKPNANTNTKARSIDRNTAMARAYASGDYTLQQVADAFGVHYATVSRAVRKKDN